LERTTFEIPNCLKSLNRIYQNWVSGGQMGINGNINLVPAKIGSPPYESGKFPTKPQFFQYFSLWIKKISLGQVKKYLGQGWVRHAQVR